MAEEATAPSAIGDETHGDSDVRRSFASDEMAAGASIQFTAI